MLTTYDAATQMRQSQVQQLLQLLWSIPWKPTEAETLPEQMALASLLHVFLSVLHKMSYESVCLPFSAVQTVQTVSGGTKCNSLLSVESPLKRKASCILDFCWYFSVVPNLYQTTTPKLSHAPNSPHAVFCITDPSLFRNPRIFGHLCLMNNKKELKLSANRNKFVSGINLGRK